MQVVVVELTQQVVEQVILILLIIIAMVKTLGKEELSIQAIKQQKDMEDLKMVPEAIIGAGGGGFYGNGTSGNRNNAGGNSFISGGAKITGKNGCIAGFGGGGMSYSNGENNAGGAGGRRWVFRWNTEEKMTIVDMVAVVAVTGLVLVAMLKVDGKILQLQMVHMKLVILEMAVQELLL